MDVDKETGQGKASTGCLVIPEKFRKNGVVCDYMQQVVLGCTYCTELGKSEVYFSRVSKRRVDVRGSM